MGKRKRMVDTSVPEHEVEVGPSRKRQRAARLDLAARLESMGARLAALSVGGRAKLELGEELEAELAILRNMGFGKALPRQRRRVAGFLRALDLDDLERRLEEVEGKMQRPSAVSGRLEALRRELVEGGDEALTALFTRHPTLDRQRVGQAVRAARREAAAGEGRKRFKQLYALLAELGLGDVREDS